MLLSPEQEPGLGFEAEQDQVKVYLWKGYLSTAKKLLVDKGILRKVAMALIWLIITGFSSYSDNPSNFGYFPQYTGESSDQNWSIFGENSTLAFRWKEKMDNVKVVIVCGNFYLLLTQSSFPLLNCKQTLFREARCLASNYRSLLV